jgi:hypothetical protein
MPSTKDRNDVRARVCNPYGAGGEPPGEPPAPLRSPRQQRSQVSERRSQVSERLIDDAVDRARLRAMMGRPDGDRISAEVIDELLAGAETEQEIAGPGGSARAADPAAGGKGDGGRADRRSGL